VSQNGVRFWREIDQQTICVLAALSIDSPYLRWQRVKQYIASERKRALAEIREAVREILFYERVRRNCGQREKPEAGPNRDDVADAIAWFDHTFPASDEQAS
jgi:hypothetical protein